MESSPTTAYILVGDDHLAAAMLEIDRLRKIRDAALALHNRRGDTGPALVAFDVAMSELI